MSLGMGIYAIDGLHIYRLMEKGCMNGGDSPITKHACTQVANFACVFSLD